MAFMVAQGLRNLKNGPHVDAVFAIKRCRIILSIPFVACIRYYGLCIVGLN